MGHPILFVDIDGVLNPYDGPCPEGYREHPLFPDEEPVRIAGVHGQWLHELAEHFDMMWGSSWIEADRALLATLLDLPEFVGAVDLPTGQFDPALKVPAVDMLAGPRPAAWIDDLLQPNAWEWARQRTAPTLLIPIDPSTGLMRAHVDHLLAGATSPDWAV